MTLSRRHFAQLVAVGVGAAATGRKVIAGTTTTPATQRLVRLSANENPYGPSPIALDAMRNALATAPRYPDDEMDELIAAIAKLHNVSEDQVILGDGSSEILKVVAAAFTNSARKLVMADPTFEAIEHYARAAGADTVKVGLTSGYAHDLAKMAAVPDTGAIYVCNPNNPTGSITPKQRIREFLDAVPPTTIVLVDEAYHHYAEGPDYESVMPLIATHPNLVVARTFSKIFAMAGLRAGYGIASREIASRMKNQQQWDTMNVLALTGARASLGDAKHVADGRARNSETRRTTAAALQRLGYTVVPSEANFIMIDTRKHVKPLIASMRDKGVRVGRLFPTMPNYLRVTIGTPQEMQRFVEVFQTAVA
jgi:histidinol-phosphate aminotransferase